MTLTRLPDKPETEYNSRMSKVTTLAKLIRRSEQRDYGTFRVHPGVLDVSLLPSRFWLQVHHPLGTTAGIISCKGQTRLQAGVSSQAPSQT